MIMLYKFCFDIYNNNIRKYVAGGERMYDFHEILRDLKEDDDFCNFSDEELLEVINHISNDE